MPLSSRKTSSDEREELLELVQWFAAAMRRCVDWRVRRRRRLLSIRRMSDKTRVLGSLLSGLFDVSCYGCCSCRWRLRLQLEMTRRRWLQWVFALRCCSFQLLSRLSHMVLWKVFINVIYYLKIYPKSKSLILLFSFCFIIN